MKQILFIALLAWSLTSCKSHSPGDVNYPSAIRLSDTAYHASSVYLTSDTANNPVISWCETDESGKKHFFASYFDTRAATFNSTFKIPIEQEANLHEEGMPKIVIKGDGTIIAMYETSSPTALNKYAGSLRFIQSFDRGRRWTEPSYVHSDTAQGKSRSFASLMRLADGEVAACWLDAAYNEKKGGRPVRFATTLGKNGFTNEILIDSFACECCRTAIATDRMNNVSVVYRDIVHDSIRDISLSQSRDNGRTFDRPVNFSADNWQLDGCPHNGPAIATSEGLNYTAWFTGGPQKGVYYAELDQAGRTQKRKLLSSSGRYIQLCLLEKNRPVLAFNETGMSGDSVYSKLVVIKNENDQLYHRDITGLTSNASFPVIHRIDADRFVVAWSERGQVFYAVVDTDNIREPLPDTGILSGRNDDDSTASATPAHAH